MTEILRFTTADDVASVGWLGRPDTDTDVAVVHVHGMSGNGFENLLIDSLRESHLAESRAFFSFNNRGSGIVTWVNRSDGSKFLGGACYERFEDSALDIEAAIGAAEEAGYSRVILQGHSLGCTKVVNYLASKDDRRVEAAILLAPTDMRGWALRTEAMRSVAARAEDMVASGRGEELVGEAAWDDAPISARVVRGYAAAGGAADIYGTQVARNLDLPLLVAYGSADIGITEIDGDIDTWQQRAVEAFPSSAKFVTFDGASHSFRECLDDLAEASSTFCAEI